MKRFFPSVFLAVFLTLICSLSAWAQTTTALVLTSTQLDEKAHSSTSKTYLQDDKMKTELPDQEQEVLFDAEKETVYLINHKKKEYVEMTREDMEALSSMLREQMAMMEKQLEMLPEEQRAMIRKKMGAAVGSGQSPAEYSLEASDVPVKEWKTNKYSGMSDGGKQSEVYIASYEELELDKEDFAAMESFFSLMKNYAQSMSKSISGNGIGFFSESMPGYTEGVPVKIVFYNTNGDPIITQTIDSINEEEVEEAIFILPEKYRKKKMEGLSKN